MKKYIKPFLLFLLYLSFSSIVVEVLTLFKIDIKSFSITARVLLSAFLDASLMFIFIFIYRKALTKDLEDFKQNKWKYLKIGIGVWIVSVICMTISNNIIFSFYPHEATNEVVVQEYIKKFPIYMIFSSVIVAPILEELIFRKSLRDCIKNNFLYIIISGALFGYVHTLANSSNILELLYIIPYGIVGSAFAYLYTKTKNIYTTISLHMIHNFIVVFISILMYKII